MTDLRCSLDGLDVQSLRPGRLMRNTERKFTDNPNPLCPPRHLEYEAQAP